MCDIVHLVIGPRYGRCFDCSRWLCASDGRRCNTCKEKWQAATDAMKRAFELIQPR